MADENPKKPYTSTQQRFDNSLSAHPDATSVTLAAAATLTCNSRSARIAITLAADTNKVTVSNSYVTGDSLIMLTLESSAANKEGVFLTSQTDGAYVLTQAGSISGTVYANVLVL